jgi:hypothetical protein
MLIIKTANIFGKVSMDVQLLILLILKIAKLETGVNFFHQNIQLIIYLRQMV